MSEKTSPWVLAMGAAVTLAGAGLTLALVLGAGIRGHRIAKQANDGDPPVSE